jgi:hypothetical protein
MEPFVFSLLFIKNIVPIRKNSFFNLALKCQSVGVCLGLLIYIAPILKDFYTFDEVDILRLNVNGYAMKQWVDFILPNNESILLDSRTKANYSRKAVSIDSLHWPSPEKKSMEALKNQLIINDVKFLITTNSSPIYAAAVKCSKSLYAGPVEFEVITRNKLNSGSKYNAYIYLIDNYNFTDCILDRFYKDEGS